MSSKGREFFLSFFIYSVCTEMTSTYFQPDLKLVVANLVRRTVFGLGSASERHVLLKCL